MLKALIAAAALMLATPAAAQVIERTADSFTLRYEIGAEIDPGDIPGVMGEISQWWDGDHTYSGEAANLTLDPTPGGCWCERLTDGTDFRHATVVSVSADGMVLEAPLGPLNGKATRAELTVGAAPVNMGWTPTWTFVVEGPGVGVFADGVDGVMHAAFRRWLRYLEYGEPHPAPDA